MRRIGSDRGATAVEFALVMVPLFLILFGIVDFGSAYSKDLSLTAAAREGVRVMAVKNDPVAARTAVRSATQQLSPSLTDAQIAISPAACAAGTTVTVTVTYPMTSVSGMFSSIMKGHNLIAVGVMRCGG
ncbi:TadE-like protein [Nakamurella panacisegetis]|uniref:TadE-like protein n=1 Tax=Nakamurella panacisegetis TaxID=1090615 RepID=A0A1H0HN17_9ACTN|nr:TadE family protein [Nakamurella panacisegetis]SDO20608.1 TadE-like protein [Nakamurella panacisegetis]